MAGRALSSLNSLCYSSPLRFLFLPQSRPCIVLNAASQSAHRPPTFDASLYVSTFCYTLSCRVCRILLESSQQLLCTQPLVDRFPAAPPASAPPSAALLADVAGEKTPKTARQQLFVAPNVAPYDWPGMAVRVSIQPSPKPATRCRHGIGSRETG
ncbi:hypothetical protein P153DRAFT_371142 [Dothidotthia symphoricarpi CBS 119687]|uniref:Uncharacterized protein n=1 Tax=Dothidotthia symphoricarpi CBS 119687 TaxID=1392245 RepID=A0A6A5ZZ38_9PLEO|nr:uncharacterized protein P153DRAFT_371142 [Dothidotthia symphoricarpi CBS 119687]KAF2124285.1 hypothetical protein P153DRAFT_371142 [Dothidotthia symphoricarpi CBS 119687]